MGRDWSARTGATAAVSASTLTDRARSAEACASRSIWRAKQSWTSPVDNDTIEGRRRGGMPAQGRSTMAEAISIHPSVDQGLKPAAANFSGGTLVCKCARDQLKVK